MISPAADGTRRRPAHPAVIALLAASSLAASSCAPVALGVGVVIVSTGAVVISGDDGGACGSGPESDPCPRHIGMVLILIGLVIELYDLDRRRIRASVLAAPLSPRLLPDAAAWAARHVAGDPRDDDATCPGAR